MNITQIWLMFSKEEETQKKEPWEGVHFPTKEGTNQNPLQFAHELFWFMVLFLSLTFHPSRHDLKLPGSNNCTLASQATKITGMSFGCRGIYFYGNSKSVIQYALQKY